jgi:hypothetical protein
MDMAPFPLVVRYCRQAKSLPARQRPPAWAAAVELSTGSLAAQPTAAHADVGEQQDDKDNREDYPNHHCTSNSERETIFLPSIFVFR